MSNPQLDAESLQFIEAHGRRLTLPEGTFVFHEGDACNGFVLVTQGSIRVQKVSESGRMMVLYRVDPDNLCILTTSCLIGNRAYNAEGFCESETTALMLDKSRFKELMDRSAPFREFVFSSLSDRLASLILKINEVALSNIDHRLAQLLLNHCQAAGPWPREISLTHQDMASELGTAREVVSRHLKKLEGQGVLKLGHGRIEVLNPESLRNITNN